MLDGKSNYNTDISISPDIPPVLQSLKKDILRQRKDLPPEIKKSARIQYLKEWPYIKMFTSSSPDPIYPAVDKNTIVKTILNTDPYLRITEPVTPN